MPSHSLFAEHRLLAFREVPETSGFEHRDERPEHAANAENRTLRKQTGDELHSLRQSIEKDPLLERTTLEAMTPALLEKMLLKRWENSMSRESDVLLANACFSVVDLICRCSKAEALMKKMTAASPEQAFSTFASYKTAPYAIDLLEAAAFRLGKSEVALELMERMDALKQLPLETRKRILDAMYGKVEESELARSFLKTDRTNSNKERLLKDPALSHWSKIEESWIDWKKMASIKPSGHQDQVWKLQVRAMIARNLFFQGKDVNEQTVGTEALRIARTRELYAKIPLFKGRNVLHVANNEKIRDVHDENGQPYSEADYAHMEQSFGANRFGQSAVRQEIRRQIGRVGEYSFIRPTKSVESLKQSKAAVLNALRTMEPPATFLFDGHGSPDAFYLSDGSIPGTAKIGEVAETKTTMKITVQELAAALRERADKFDQSNLTSLGYRDFFIFDSCFNADFIRGLYERMGDAPKPIVLGASEYGQYAYSELGSQYGGEFLGEVLNLGKNPAGTTTFGDVFHNELEGDSNPSLYIPDQEGLPMQITRNDGEDGDLLRS